jgi:hypothetical protein
MTLLPYTGIRGLSTLDHTPGASLRDTVVEKEKRERALIEREREI